MATTFTGFLVQLDQAISTQNGPNLAYLLRTSSPHGKDLVKETRNPTEHTLSRYKGKMESPWDEIAIRYVLVVNHVTKQRPGDAFREQDKLVLAFFRYLVNHSGWTLPALFCLLRDLRDLAFDADFYAKQSGEKSEYMENAARTIQKALSNCMTDRTSPYDQSRKWGVYYVVGLILKCYFRVKRISLAKNIFRALEGNTDRPPLSAYPRSHQVTYHFYTGMISFLNEEYEKSENELSLAFYSCLLDARNNQERTLAYLIPLRLLRGHLPSTELLQRFPQLDQLFSPFIAAIRRGDLRAFDSALERSERKLSELSLFFTLERARELCMRGLFRRVWVALEKTNRMTIGMFRAALALSGMAVEAEEAECLVANMIYKGYMKGYISHEKQMVVLSNKDAFPRVADRAAPFAFLS